MIPTETPPPADTGIPILDRAVDAFHSHDPAQLEALWTTDAPVLVPGGPELRGGAAWAAYNGAFFAAFTDGTLEVHLAAEQDGAVIQEATFTGRHTGDFPLPDGGVLAATERIVSVRYVEIFWMKGELIDRVHLFYDRLALLEQLGA